MWVLEDVLVTMLTLMLTLMLMLMLMCSGELENHIAFPSLTLSELYTHHNVLA